MKKNVAIVTMTEGLNIGNSLQNYALQMVLKKFKVDSYTLISADNYFHTDKSILVLFKKNTIKRIIGFLINYNNFRNYILELQRKKNVFKQFDKYIQFKKINDIDLESISLNFDYFIAGSDQIWNPEYKASNFEFLTFAPFNKRIAYAASFGVTNIPKQLKRQYKNWLNGLKFISVREKAGAEIIQELTKRHVEILVDPTLLLGKKEWLKIARKPSFNTTSKYILVYFLGKKYKFNQFIQTLANQKNLVIIDIFDTNKVGYIGPAEFIYLIANAEFVFTDSFHGTIFSIIFSKQFIVVERDDKVDMSSRLTTLLQTFDLTDRYIKNLCDCDKILNKKINFDSYVYILEKEYKKAESYLRVALNIE